LVTLSTVKGISMYDSENINFTNVIVKNNFTGIAIYNCGDIVFTSCQSYDDRETPLQEFGMELYEGNTGINLLNCKLTPNASGDIYNPNGVAVKVITEKMLAKF
jgi:parallel beta-helix repeat protein